MQSTTLGEIIRLNVVLDNILAMPKGERNITKYRDTVLQLHQLEKKHKKPMGFYRNVFQNGGNIYTIKLS